jgi:REP element-mobilizing transposase RayT
MVVIYLHVIIYVADGRKPFDESLNADVTAFITTVLRYKGVFNADVCVLEDHVHLLIRLPEEAELKRIMYTVKIWLQDFVKRHSGQTCFEWSNREWVVSKSPADLSAMRKFFSRQLNYHAIKSVEEEWTDLLDWEEMDEPMLISESVC